MTTFTTFTTKRPLNIEELREVLVLMANQETSDRNKDTYLDIDGDYAHIQVSVDDMGNVTVL